MAGSEQDRPTQLNIIALRNQALRNQMFSSALDSLPEGSSVLDHGETIDEVERSIIAFFDAENPERHEADFFSEEGLEDALSPQKPQE